MRDIRRRAYRTDVAHASAWITEDELEREYEKPEFEQPVDDINWTTGVGQPAGMYWMEGRTVMAAHDSPAERRLVDAGAILVATLRFDADPVERRHRTGRVTRVSAGRAAALSSPALN